MSTLATRHQRTELLSRPKGLADGFMEDRYVRSILKIHPLMNKKDEAYCQAYDEAYDRAYCHRCVHAILCKSIAPLHSLAGRLTRADAKICMRDGYN